MLPWWLNEMRFSFKRRLFQIQEILQNLPSDVFSWNINKLMWVSGWRNYFGFSTVWCVMRCLRNFLFSRISKSMKMAFQRKKCISLEEWIRNWKYVLKTHIRSSLRMEWDFSGIFYDKYSGEGNFNQFDFLFVNY